MGTGRESAGWPVRLNAGRNRAIDQVREVLGVPVLGHCGRGWGEQGVQVGEFGVDLGPEPVPIALGPDIAGRAFGPATSQ